jgi:hypothetical protein
MIRARPTPVNEATVRAGHLDRSHAPTIEGIALRNWNHRTGRLESSVPNPRVAGRLNPLEATE